MNIASVGIKPTVQLGVKVGFQKLVTTGSEKLGVTGVKNVGVVGIKKFTAHELKNVGEEALGKSVGGVPQAYIYVKNMGGRYIDWLVGKVAHEAKTGFKTLNKKILEQIKKDAELIRTKVLTESVWHFYISPKTGLGGASKELLAELKKYGIKVVNEFKK